MKKSHFWMLLALVTVLTSGCAIRHDYTWQEYQIAAAKISPDVHFSEEQAISIVSGDSDKKIIFLGNVGAHQYFGSEQSLADGIVEQLSKELAARGLKVAEGEKKSLEIKVNGSHFEQGMWKIAATLDCSIKFGNGKENSFSVRNSSPATVDRTYNGAVAMAVIKIINDPEVLAYIAE